MDFRHQKNDDLNYDLYRDIADDLSSQVDQKLEPEVRYELYQSKLVYLTNLQIQCFKQINLAGSKSQFQNSDLANIILAIEMTHKQMRDTVLEAMDKCLARVA